jgi:hypothetical protein
VKNSIRIWINIKKLLSHILLQYVRFCMYNNSYNYISQCWLFALRANIRIGPQTSVLNGNSYSRRRIHLSWLFRFKLFKLYSNILKRVNLIEIRFYAPSFLVLWHTDIFFETTAQIPEVKFGGKYGCLRVNITRVILRPLSALSLDEGLNSPCDKNASAALWKREPISDD